LICAVTVAGSFRSAATENVTSACLRSTMPTSSTWPTRTPAIRTSSPGSSSVASENRAV
jgi:hypothetical protein